MSPKKVSTGNFKKVRHKGKHFLNSKQDYWQARKDQNHLSRMSSLRKLNLSGRQDCSFDSGLLSDYESRRTRFGSKSSELSSPVRSIYKSNNRDENAPFKSTFSPVSGSVSSPIRSASQSFRGSPLSHSKRYNVNLEQGSEDTFLTSRQTFNDDSSCSPLALSRTRSSLNSSNSALRSTEIPNWLKVGQFPWVSPKHSMLPMPQSPSYQPTNNSPLRTSESTTPIRTRVRVRLAGPNKSDLSADSSNQDLSVTIDDACTTKSVIQVLKEISRKRALAPSEDDELQQEAKRRQDHSLYVSRTEPDEENPIPTRTNGEDDRKRYREPDWDSPPNMAGPKRRKKNHVVNNEILSSLSSSIGLIRQINVIPVVVKPKKTTSVGTQVCLKDSSDEKEIGKLNAEKPVKEVKEAATMPDPPPPPRPRSPVKEKAVTDLNGILKSALSKFKIQPKQDSKNDSPSSSTCVSSEKANASSTAEPVKIAGVTSASSTMLPTSLPVSSNQTLNKEAFPAFGTQTGSFTSTSSSPPKITFGSSQLPLGITSEKDKTSNGADQKQGISSSDKKSEESSANDTKSVQPTGLNFKPMSETPKGDSTFVFGQTSSPTLSLNQPNSGVQSPSNQNVSVAQSPPLLNSLSQSTPKVPALTSLSTTNSPSTTTQSPFKLANSTPQFSSAQPSTGVVSPFKLPEATTSATSASIPTTSFSFGGTSAQIGKSQDQTSTTVTQSQNALTSSKTTGVTDTTKSEPFKFETSGFNFQGTPKEPSKEEKKDINNTGLFTFGNSENKPAIGTEKTEAVNKPFQFGSGGFAFGQSSNQTKEVSNNPVVATSTAVPPSGSDKPIFSFTANAQKKEEPAGGFSFKLPTTTAPTTAEQKPIFSFSGNSTTTATTTSANTGSTSSVISTGSNAKPIFPASIFGNSSATTQGTNNNPAAITQSTPVSTTVNTSSTFGSGSAFSSPGKGFSATTTSTSTPTFGSVTPAFGSGNKAIFGNPTTASSSSSPFGIVTNNQAATSSIFGSNAGSAGNTSAFSTNNITGPTFGATANNTPTFGNIASGSKPAFGAPTTTATSFGSTTTPTFGSAASVGGSTVFNAASGNNAPAFGSALATTTTPSFGATNTTTPSFGSLQTSTPSIFGAPSSTATTAPFGGGVASTTSFGSSPASGTSGPSLFGSSNATPAFGGASTPAFGGSTTTSPPAFGSQTQGFGAQSGTTFGNTPAFGQSTPAPFGGQTTFASQPAGSSFGSAPAFGSASSAFSSTSSPAAPAFGSPAPAFGSTPAFGSQDASKPFTFNAPAPQPASGGFNFSASQPQPQPSTSSSGLFQFGASNTQPNQPFQFNAAQPNSSVGGTGQQMFSIGSGSTAPRRVTTAARRKK